MQRTLEQVLRQGWYVGDYPTRAHTRLLNTGTYASQASREKKRKKEKILYIETLPLCSGHDHTVLTICQSLSTSLSGCAIFAPFLGGSAPVPTARMSHTAPCRFCHTEGQRCQTILVQALRDGDRALERRAG